MAKVLQNQPYQSPTPGKITLMAFGPNSGTAVMTDALCQELKDCGFNSAAIETTLTNALPTITNCAKYGIKPFLHTAGMEDSVATCTTFVNRCKNAQGLGGWLVKSGVKEIEATAESKLCKSVDSIRKNDQYKTIITYKYTFDYPHNKVVKETVRITYPHSIFMSALNSGDIPQSITSQAYKTYIEAFQDNLQPTFWPFFSFPTALNTITFPTSAFYRELEIFAMMARYTNGPMWPYLRCQIEAGSVSPVPTDTEVRLRSAAFSAMAYGAQGLVWWTYRPTKSSTGKDFNGLVDGNGNKTLLWNIVKKINSRISALNFIFAGSIPVECRHTGTTYYAGTCLLKGAIGPVVSLLTGSAGVLVSHLSNGGDDYLVIVNHPGAPLQKLTLGVSSLYKIERIAVSTTGTITKSLISSYNLEINLGAGEMEIFRWW